MNSLMLLDYISNLIIGAGIFQGLFQALILLRIKKGNRNANRLLGLLLLVFSLNIAHSTFSSEVWYDGGLCTRIAEPFQLLFGPAVYFYVRVLTDSCRAFKKQYLIHFIPFTVYSLLLITFYPSYFPGSSNSGLTTIIVWGAILLHITSYTLLAVKASGMHNNRIKAAYSDIDKLNMNWLKYFILVLHGIYVVYYLLLILMIFTPKGADLFPHYQKLISIVLSIALFSLGYRGLTRPQAFIYDLDTGGSQSDNENINIAVSEEAKSDEPEIKDDSLLELSKGLLNYIDEEKPYLNPELTLPELSEAVGIPRNRLSQIINEKLGMNFYDFINGYRVKEVQKLITDPDYDHLTILSLAFDAGFNSKSTFNSIFKKHSGMTPSTYKKLHRGSGSALSD
ncbi:MAG: helix-turn-helix domain-containing protein [Bacillota bacterium]|nr:helix-turn-helix domain-containing protein [Bacillota bacterium]